jgi:hypothetical protein
LKVTFVEGRPSYSGSTRNGVTSHDWAAFPNGFVLERTNPGGAEQ